MDLTTLLHMLLSNFWFLIPLFLFIAVIQSAWFKGLFGEWQVNRLIKLFLDKNEYHLIKNVTLPTTINGKEHGTTQIDHIIVSKYGIFVVETKNMKGWIFGSVNQKQWTQKIYKHSTKFQNPLHQNYKHVKTIEDALLTEHSTKNNYVFSVIIFIGDSTFKTQMPNNVTYARGGIEYIKAKQTIVFSDTEVASIINNIENGRLQRGFKTNRQHVKHVNAIIEEKQNTKACAKCGSDMLLRKAKKGTNAGNEFWGCSSFPKCRNILKVG